MKKKELQELKTILTGIYNHERAVSGMSYKGSAEYVLYHGDEFVDIGTAYDLSEKYNITTNAIYKSSSNYRRGKTGESAKTIIFKIEGDEDYEKN